MTLVCFVCDACVERCAPSAEVRDDALDGEGARGAQASAQGVLRLAWPALQCWVPPLDSLRSVVKKMRLRSEKRWCRSSVRGYVCAAKTIGEASAPTPEDPDIVWV